MLIDAKYFPHLAVERENRIGDSRKQIIPAHKSVQLWMRYISFGVTSIKTKWIQLSESKKTVKLVLVFYFKNVINKTSKTNTQRHRDNGLRVFSYVSVPKTKLEPKARHFCGPTVEHGKNMACGAPPENLDTSHPSFLILKGKREI